MQWAGAGAAASLVARRIFAKDADPAAQPATKQRAGRAFELGLASYTTRKFSLDQTLAMANRVGLKCISLKDMHLPMNSTPEQLAEAATKVKAAGIDLYAVGVVYMKTSAEVERAFEYAKGAGVKLIVGVPNYDLLPLVNEKVQKYDIRVAIHNHGPKDKLYPKPGVAYEKIKDLDRRMGICLDIGHAVHSGIDPSSAAEQFADRVFDVHMKDIAEATETGKTVECGRGVIDLPKFLRTLEKIHYAGKVSFELENNPDDPLPGLAESVGYTRGVLAVI
jgi:sugar phosphate isomerase/epimerase